MSSGFYRKALQDWREHSIANWPSIESFPSTHSETLILVDKWMRNEAQILENQTIFNDKKIKTLVRNVRIRKTIYSSASAMIVVTVLVTVALVVIALWPIEGPPEIRIGDIPLQFGSFRVSYTVLLAGSFGMMALSAILKFWSGKIRFSETFKSYLSDELSEESKILVVQSYESIKEGSQRLIIRMKDNSLTEVSDFCLNSENSFLLLPKNSSHRRGIVLLGRPLQGEALLRKSEIETLSDGKPYTRNTRDFTFQRRYLSTIDSLLDTYSKINAAKISGRLIGSALKLSGGRIPRFEAMKFVADKREFWESSNRLLYLTKNPAVKEDFLRIFKPLSRNITTLSDLDVGEVQMHNFIDLKDRALEKWLRNLNDSEII